MILVTFWLVPRPSSSLAQNFPTTLSPPTWVLPGASYDFNFVNQQYWASGQTVALSQFFTFTRNLEAWEDNQSGVWQSFPTTVPRITDKGALIELGATNSALRSRDMTQVDSWTASNITATKTATGIDGVANSASTLTATADNGTILQSITLASAADVYSVWLKRRTGTGNIDITIDNGSTWTTQTVTSTYTRFQVTKTAANPIIGIRIVTSGDAVDADFNQLEAGSQATSGITTTTAGRTKPPDVLIFRNTATAPISDQVGTVFVEWQQPPTGVTPTGSDLTQLRTDGNNSVSVSISATSKVTATNTSGGSNTFIQASTNAVTNSTIYRTAFSYAVNNFAVGFSSALNTAAITQVTAAAVPVGTITGVGIGGSAPGTLQCNCYVRRWAYNPANLQPAQLLNWTQGP